MLYIYFYITVVLNYHLFFLIYCKNTLLKFINKTDFNFEYIPDKLHLELIDQSMNIHEFTDHSMNIHDQLY